MAPRRLFNLSDNEVQSWINYKVDDSEYELGHLDALKVSFQHPEREECYTIYFTFSNHCFTRSIKDDERPDLSSIYPYPKDRRVFDLRRYSLSRQLPQIIETLPEHFCFHGGYSRYCSCRVTEDDGNEVEYQIVYRVWKANGKMRFHVESAYL